MTGITSIVAQMDGALIVLYNTGPSNIAGLSDANGSPDSSIIQFTITYTSV